MKFLKDLNPLIAFLVLIWAILGILFDWLTIGDFTLFLVLTYLIIIQGPSKLPKA